MYKNVAAVGFAFALGLAGYLGATASADAADVNLRMATDSGSEGSPAGDAVDRWAELIETNSNGEIAVDVFYQHELGGQQEVFDQFVMGNVDIMLNWPMTSYDSRLSVLYTPFMLDDWEDALEAYQPGGWLNEILGDIFADIGLTFFGAWPEGFNGVATADRYATTIEDADGLRVRTPPVFPFSQSMEAMGYQTSAIDWGEVYTAIQTGVVDGDSGNVIYYDYEYFRDQLDYYVHTKHMFITGTLTMNTDSWNALSEEHQAIVQDAAVQVMEQHFQDAREVDEYYRERAVEAGMEYIALDDEERAALAEATRAEVWPLMEEEIGSEIMDYIRANATTF